jgi:hypothetical protein
MDRKGFKHIEQAMLPAKGTEVQGDGPAKGEDQAFVEIETFRPARVFNGLHKAGLLASPDNRSTGTKHPRLEWIDTVPINGARKVVMTFLDQHSETSSEFRPR